MKGKLLNLGILVCGVIFLSQMAASKEFSSVSETESQINELSRNRLNSSCDISCTDSRGQTSSCSIDCETGHSANCYCDSDNVPQCTCY
jgi:hypothetical protein